MSIYELNQIRFTEQLREATDNSEGDGNDSRRTYLAYGQGATSKENVAASFIVIVPNTDGGNVLRRIRYTETGYHTWTCAAEYITPERHARQKRLDDGEFRWQFNTAGGTVKITHSPEGNYTKYGTSAIDYKGAINVNKGRVEGVDINQPGLQLDLSYKHSLGQITPAYMQLLETLTRHRNDQAFFGFAAGELLFLNASGSDGSNSPAEVTYHFLIDHDVDNLTFGDITGVSKPAHAYLWIDYEDDEDTTAKTLRPIPRGVYVHTLYEDTDFNQFGLTL